MEEYRASYHSVAEKVVLLVTAIMLMMRLVRIDTTELADRRKLPAAFAAAVPPVSLNQMLFVPVFWITSPIRAALAAMGVVALVVAVPLRSVPAGRGVGVITTGPDPLVTTINCPEEFVASG
jgi:hypothetical protein